jgi:hypothetical protein
VFSMTKSNREEFSAQLGVEPVLLDTCHFSGCRRPRPFWVDWPIEARRRNSTAARRIPRVGHSGGVAPGQLVGRQRV